MDTPLHTPAVVRPLPLRRPLRWLQAARTAWQSARRRAADRRALQAMGEAELRDLGIGRGEATYLSQPDAKPRAPW